MRRIPEDVIFLLLEDNYFKSDIKVFTQGRVITYHPPGVKQMGRTSSRASKRGCLFLGLIIFTLSTASFLHLPIDTSMGDAADTLSASSQRGSNPTVTFVNVSKDAGLEGVRGDCFAWGDYNDDGYQDFLIRGNLTSGTRLFHNDGPPNFQFTDVTVEAGIDDRGYAIWGDIDNDGDLDILLADFHESLWRNNDDGTFTNITATAGGLLDGAQSESAGWGDYDSDGYIDLYVVNWRKPGGTGTWPDYGMPDKLWHNNGDGTFTDVSTQAGIIDSNPSYAGMGCAWGDYDDDGDLDIYVGNYHLNPNYLWQNQGDGTFVNVAQTANVTGDPDYYQGSGPYHGHTAGSAWADYDNDLDLDLWVSNLAHKDDERSGMNRGAFCDDSMLFRSSGAPDYEFDDVRVQSGIPIIPVGAIEDNMWKDEDYFGVTWGDYDNDGDQDLWIPQVKTYHPWAHSVMWRNDGDATFTDVTDTSALKVWSNTGAAWCDYDNDGDLDLLTEGAYPYQGKRQVHLFQNPGTSNHWLHIDLRGTESNWAAIGARVIIRDGDRSQMREVEGGSGGHCFQNSMTLEFGFGDSTGPVDIEVRWPSGRVQEMMEVSLDKKITIFEGPGVEITSLTASPEDPVEDEPITFSYSALEDGTPVSSLEKTQWDLDGDGVYDWFGTGAEVPTIAFNESGNYKITFRGGFVDGGADTKTIEITVTNVPPTANAGIDIMVNEDDMVYFISEASTDTPSDLPSLEFKWDFGDNTGTDWDTSIDANHTYTLQGAYTVTLTVRDDDNETDLDTTIVTVSNLPPIAIPPNDFSVKEDWKAIFDGDGTDTPSDVGGLVYRWDFDDGEITQWGTDAYTTHIYTLSGSYNPTLEVKDPDGDIGSATINVTVTNVAPSCVALFEDEDQDEREMEIEEDDEIGFDGTASDTASDQSTLRYSWDFGDGAETNFTNGPEEYHTYTEQGTYDVVMTIEDDDGAVNTSSLTVEVENVDPKAVMQLDKLSLNEDESLSCDAQRSTDTPSDLETLTYDWSIDGESIGNTTLLTRTFYTSGKHGITLTVTDDDGATSTDTKVVQVANIDPVALFIASHSNVETGVPVTFDASASTDTPSDLQNLTYSWNFGDLKTGTGSSIDHTYTEPGSFIVTLTTEDDDGATSKRTVTIVVEGGSSNIDSDTDADEDGDKALAIGIALAIIVGTLVLIAILTFLIKPKGPTPQSPIAPPEGIQPPNEPLEPTPHEPPVQPVDWPLPSELSGGIRPIPPEGPPPQMTQSPTSGSLETAAPPSQLPTPEEQLALPPAQDTTEGP